MKRNLSLLLLIMMVHAGPGLLASGVEKEETKPEPSPRQTAVESFNSGVDHRDRAWKYEKQLEGEGNPSKVASLEKKAWKEYERAISYYETAIRHDSSFFQAYSGLGYALRKTGDYERSLEAYDHALELEPDYAEAIEYRGEAYLGLERVEDAKAAYLILANGGSERASELLVAMRKYVDEKSADGADVGDFGEWVASREEVESTGSASSGSSWQRN